MLKLIERPEHRRALKGLHLASAPAHKDPKANVNGVQRVEHLAEGSKGRE